MPVKVIKETIPPEAFIEFRGVTVYHCYEGGEMGNPLPYLFTTDVEENPGFAFDTRDLLKELGHKGISPDRYAPEQDAKAIIQHAMNAGLLRFPDGVSPTPSTTLLCPKCGSSEIAYTEWLLVRRQVQGLDAEGVLRVSKEMKAVGKTRDQAFACRDCKHEFVQEVAAVKWDDESSVPLPQQVPSAG